MSTQVLEQTDRLVLRRSYRAPIEKVWEAWTEPDQVALWFGCGDVPIEVHEYDLKVGGAIRIRACRDDGPMDLVGHFLEITPKNKISYTWKWTGNPEFEFGETTVVVELDSTAEGTDLLLTHYPFPTPFLTEAHNHGWNASFEALAKHLEQS